MVYKYGIVIGIGGVFALLMLGITWLQNRYTKFSTKQEEVPITPAKVWNY